MIPPEIHSRLLQPNGVRQTHAMSPGLSGALVFRCDAHTPLVLRRWPSGTSPARVREIHSVIEPLAMISDLIPGFRSTCNQTETFVVDTSGMIWELATWLPGQPLRYDAKLDDLKTGAAAIASVHQKLSQLGTWHQPVQAITERLDRLNWLDQQLPGCFAASLGGRVHPSVESPLASAMELLRAKWAANAPRITALLQPFKDRPLPVQFVLRDIHRENMLFSDGSVSGIIDFDAVRVDTTAVDLARWGSSFSEYVRNPSGTLASILAGYHSDPTLSQQPIESGDFDTKLAIGGQEDPGRLLANPQGLDDPPENPSTSEFPTLVLAISESSHWLSLANWVVWLVGQSRQFPDFQPVAERLRRLVEAVNAHSSR